MDTPQFEWITRDDWGFEISKYLVTNRQYECFVIDGGYEQDQYWKPEWGDKLSFQRSRWPQPNRPKTTVSWVEAMAFCDWYSKKAAHAESAISLPTELQWQTAVLNHDQESGEVEPEGDVSNDIYPWGDNANDVLKGDTIHDFANVGGKLGQTSTVGLYAKGATELGISDMAGNVWEWCETMYAVEGDDSDWPTLRGGSWNLNPEYARARYRDLDRRHDRFDDGGFRVCRPKPSS